MYYILLPTGILRHHTVILHMHSIRRNQRPLFCTACSLKKLPLIKIFNTLQNHTHHLATPSRRTITEIMSLEGIRYQPQDGSLSILNQLLLPHEIVYEPITSVEGAWTAIREMKVDHLI